MKVVRKIYRQLPDVLKMPKELQHQHVEVILLPLDTAKDKRRGPNLDLSPLARFAGAWEGEPLIRENQGDYEIREELK